MHRKEEGMWTMLPRAQSLDRRIRESELFPRIRDAEREMVENEAAFSKKRAIEKKRKEKQRLKDIREEALDLNKPMPLPAPETGYFTGFVLNTDPTLSKFLLFDEVFYPRLFNSTTKNAPPDTIDNLWMLGFEDNLQRAQLPKVLVQTTMETLSLADSESGSRRSPAKTPKRKKKDRLKFVAVYSAP
eukprot:CAMPEP_0173361026 /NCGR_PEP_ID=MMETSP1144-20121109/20946_1 /TAXON_ID=483371 /ORGANISM="non described non described, Strain CCMP2298" /LENGTH=186 /DNA_ID=CAMNT_0014310509 /DNA_START=68 /DNA_END=624 /DNA_ORIENTATION=-